MATKAGRYGPEAALLGGEVILVPGRLVRVDLAGTATLATLYTDETKATQAANPVTIDSKGNITFFADPGDYDMKLITNGVIGEAVGARVFEDPSEEGADDADMMRLSTTQTVVGTKNFNIMRTSIHPINVMHPSFGVVGDGVTDDTAAMQAALNSVTGGGAEVFIPGGGLSPLITAPLLFPVNQVVTLYSEGIGSPARYNASLPPGASYLKYRGALHTPCIDVNSNTHYDQWGSIRGLFINTGGTQHGIRIRNAHDGTVENVMVFGAGAGTDGTAVVLDLAYQNTLRDVRSAGYDIGIDFLNGDGGGHAMLLENVAMSSRTRCIRIVNSSNWNIVGGYLSNASSGVALEVTATSAGTGHPFPGANNVHCVGIDYENNGHDIEIGVIANGSATAVDDFYHVGATPNGGIVDNSTNAVLINARVGGPLGAQNLQLTSNCLRPKVLGITQLDAGTFTDNSVGGVIHGDTVGTSKLALGGASLAGNTGLTVYGAPSQKTAVLRVNATTPDSALEVQTSGGNAVLKATAAAAGGSILRVNNGFFHPSTSADVSAVNVDLSAPTTATSTVVGYVARLQATGSLGELTAFRTNAPVLNGGATVTTQQAFLSKNQGLAGVTSAYGLVVEAQSGATLNVAARLDGGTTANLWCNSDTASIAGGIALGALRDVGIYRSAANALKLDATAGVALTGGAAVGGTSLTGTAGGLTVYGAASQKTAVFRQNATSPGKVLELQTSGGSGIFTVDLGGGNNMVQINGFLHTGTGTGISGFNADCVAPSTATSTNSGMNSRVQASGSFTIGEMNAYRASTPVVTTATASNVYGFHAANQGAAGVTNAAGIWVEAVSGAATLNIGAKLDGGTTANLWLNSDTTSIAGGIAFGTARDANLYRSAAGIVKTDGHIATVTGLGVGNSVAATTPGSVVKKMEVFDVAGTSLGFVPIYSTIT